MKIKTLKNALGMVAAISVASLSANAIPVPIQNYSFEDPVVGDGNSSYSAPPNWTGFAGGSAAIEDPNANFTGVAGSPGTLPGSANGVQYWHVNGSDAGGPGGIYQDVGQIQPNTTYTLTVAMGQRSDINNAQGTISLVNGTDNTGTTLAYTNVDVSSVPSGSFGDVVLTVTTGAGASGDLTVVLQSTTGVQIGFDNIRVDASIPLDATSLTVTNFSFEDDVQADGEQTTSTPPSAWSGFGPSIGTIRPSGGVDFPSYVDPANTTLPAPGDAYQCAYANGSCGFFQDVGALLPSKTYTLKVAVGARATVNWGEGLGVIQLVNGTDNSGTVLVTKTVSNTNPPAGGTFSDFTAVFTTPANVSGDLTIVLNTTTAVQMCFDNVRLYEQIPTSLAPVVVVPTLATPAGGSAAYAGDLVTVNEAATGPGPLYYSWQSDNGTSGTTWTTVSDFTNLSSYVQNTTGFNLPAYQFRAVVTNASGASTSAPVVLTMTNGAPVAIQNPLPQLEEFTATETARFSAAFTGTRPLTYQWQVDNGGGPVNVTKGTFNSLVLVITNLDVNDSGNYTLVVSNSFGSATNSVAGQLTVNPLPSPNAANNILLYSHEGNSQPYTPTYVLAAGNLIASTAPSDSGSGNFQQEGVAGISILTDNMLGLPGQHSEYATVGINGGSYLTYTLNTNASPQGYNLNKIVAIGGWADLNRNQVSADVYYSTVSDPQTFIYLDSYSYNGGVNNFWGNPTVGVQVVPASGWLATNVASIKFDFTGPGGTGGGGFGYSGLSELQVFGQANVAPSITIIRSGSNIVLSWPSGILYEANNVTGPWGIVTGAVSPWTVSPTAPQKFYRLQ